MITIFYLPNFFFFYHILSFSKLVLGHLNLISTTWFKIYKKCKKTFIYKHANNHVKPKSTILFNKNIKVLV